MAALIIVPAADDELDAVYDVDEDAGALIDALLESLAEDQATLGSLFRPDRRFRHQPPFEVKAFAEAQRRGKNIFTLKIWDECGELLNYRVLYAYHGQCDTYYVLSVVSRDDAYDPTKPEFDELLDRYDECGIPTYRF